MGSYETKTRNIGSYKTKTLTKYYINKYRQTICITLNVNANVFTYPHTFSTLQVTHSVAIIDFPRSIYMAWCCTCNEYLDRCNKCYNHVTIAGSFLALHVVIRLINLITTCNAKNDISFYSHTSGVGRLLPRSTSSACLCGCQSVCPHLIDGNFDTGHNITLSISNT